VDVGFIGLGDIGAPMAGRIAAGGFDLTVWNRTSSKMTPLEAAGAHVAESAVEVAERCEVVCTCIDTVQGLDEVLHGERGVVRAAHPPRIVVDNSTMPVAVTRRMGDQLAAHGIALVDAPVSGGPLGAAAGTLAVLVGGAESDVEAVRPILESYAGQITHLGPLGSGQIAKACNQMLNFATMAAIAEAVALATAHGLDVTRLPGALAGGLADSAMLREYARGSEAGEHHGITGIVEGLTALCLGVPAPEPGGRTDVLLKDLGAALEAARSGGSAAPVASVLDGVFRMVWCRQTGNTPHNQRL
jgi:3-hydroxyisobutyrate dehydrogenase